MPQYNTPTYIQQGAKSVFNLTTASGNTRVIKTGAVRAARVSVIVAGSAVGSINDTATVAGVSVSNQLFVIPNTVGIYTLDWPCTAGMVVIPGTGQTVAVTYL